MTQLAFSPNGNMLLSVSRDRSVCVFVNAVRGDSDAGFQLGCRLAKAHSRIIWGCSWSPCGRMAVTCSRDKTVKLWMVTCPDDAFVETAQPAVGVEPLASLPTFHAAVTAVDCSRTLDASRLSWILAAGLETGEIHLFGCHDESSVGGGVPVPRLVPLLRMERPDCHFGMVRRIIFDNHIGNGSDTGTDATSEAEGGQCLRFASAGGSTVRVHRIDVGKM